MDKEAINRLKKFSAAIDLIRNECEGKSADMSADRILTLLCVAINPDIRMIDVAEKTGQSVSSASRNLMALGPRQRPGVPGIDLIERYENPKNYKETLHRLNKRGERLMNNILNMLG